MNQIEILAVEIQRSMGVCQSSEVVKVGIWISIGAILWTVGWYIKHGK